MRLYNISNDIKKLNKTQNYLNGYFYAGFSAYRLINLGKTAFTQ